MRVTASSQRQHQRSGVPGKSVGAIVNPKPDTWFRARDSTWLPAWVYNIHDADLRGYTVDALWLLDGTTQVATGTGGTLPLSGLSVGGHSLTFSYLPGNTDPNNKITVETTDNGTDSLNCAIWDGAGWTLGALVPDGQVALDQPQVVRGKDGDVYAFWSRYDYEDGVADPQPEDVRGRALVTQRYDQTSDLWDTGEPEEIIEHAPMIGWPRAIANADGDMAVVYGNNQRDGYDLYAVMFDAGEWGPDARLTSDGLYYHDTSAALLNDGTVLIRSSVDDFLDTGDDPWCAYGVDVPVPGMVGFSIDPTAPVIDIVDVSPGDAATQQYFIKWVDGDMDSNATVTLGYDQDNIWGNGNETPIATNISEDDNQDWWLWRPDATLNGEVLYLYAHITDGTSEAVSYTDGPLVIDPGPPTISQFLVDGDQGLGGGADPHTADTTPTVTVKFTEKVFGTGEDVTVGGPGGGVIVPDSISGWGTNQLVLTFGTPLPRDGQYTVSLNGWSSIEDEAGNKLNGGRNDQRTFTLDTVAPEFGNYPDSVALNPGTVVPAGRSQVREIRWSFAEALPFQPEWFTLVNRDTGQPVDISGQTLRIEGNDVTLVLDEGGATPQGFLDDANYSLVLSGATDLAGNPLDGDGNGTGETSQEYNFFKLMGDFDGDGRTDLTDFLMFRQQYVAGGAPSDAMYDLDASGGAVNVTDYLCWRNSYGRSLSVLSKGLVLDEPSGAPPRQTSAASPLADWNGVTLDELAPAPVSLATGGLARVAAPVPARRTVDGQSPPTDPYDPAAAPLDLRVYSRLSAVPVRTPSVLDGSPTAVTVSRDPSAEGDLR